MWAFPGSAEFLAYLESAAEPGTNGGVIEADVCVRISRISNSGALKKLRRKRSKLAWQRGEYAGDVTGVPGSLGTSADLLDHMQTALEANRAEPELRCTVIVHLVDTSLPRLERHAAALQAQFEPANFGLVRPIGEQLRLLSMMVPGAATTPPAADFAQYLLARDLASCLPLCGGSVGDDRGGLLAALLDSGRNQPVMIDPARGPATNRSGNLAAVGALGAGKSVLAKRLIETVVAEGGQVITIDRTEAGEYVRFADALASCGVTSQVIRLGVDTGVCLDPLRIFAGDERDRCHRRLPGPAVRRRLRQSRGDDARRGGRGGRPPGPTRSSPRSSTSSPPGAAPMPRRPPCWRASSAAISASTRSAGPPSVPARRST